MSWTQIQSTWAGQVSAVVVDKPVRLRSLYVHNDLPGTIYCYDASAATSTTGPLKLRLELPHRAAAGNPDTVAVYIPDAGISFREAFFVRVSGGANCGVTYFYDGG